MNQANDSYRMSDTRKVLKKLITQSVKRTPEIYTRKGISSHFNTLCFDDQGIALRTLDHKEALLTLQLKNDKIQAWVYNKPSKRSYRLNITPELEQYVNILWKDPTHHIPDIYTSRIANLKRRYEGLVHYDIDSYRLRLETLYEAAIAIKDVINSYSRIQWVRDLSHEINDILNDISVDRSGECWVACEHRDKSIGVSGDEKYYYNYSHSHVDVEYYNMYFKASLDNSSEPIIRLNGLYGIEAKAVKHLYGKFTDDVAKYCSSNKDDQKLTEIVFDLNASFKLTVESIIMGLGLREAVSSFCDLDTFTMMVHKDVNTDSFDVSRKLTDFKTLYEKYITNLV